MRHLAAIIILLLPAALAAQTKRSAAPKWAEIGRTGDGHPVYVDPRSVKRANGIVTATVRTVFLKPVSTPKGDIRSSRTIAMFDCAKKTYAVKENWIYHDEKKGTVYEYRAPKLPGYGPAFKGRPPDVAMTYLCKS